MKTHAFTSLIVAAYETSSTPQTAAVRTACIGGFAAIGMGTASLASSCFQYL